MAGKQPYEIKCPMCHTMGLPMRKDGNDFMMHAGRVARCRMGAGIRGAEIVSNALDALERHNGRSASVHAGGGRMGRPAHAPCIGEPAPIASGKPGWVIPALDGKEIQAHNAITAAHPDIHREV